MNANFCQHLAVSEQGRGGEREGSRQEKDGGMEDLEKQTRVDLLFGYSIQIPYLSKRSTTVCIWSITSPVLKMELGYRKLKTIILQKNGPKQN